MINTLSPIAPRPRIETALVNVGKLIKRLARPVPPPAPREKRWMNG